MKPPSSYRRSASQKWRFSSTSFTSGERSDTVPDLWYETTYRQGLEEAKFSKADWCNLLSISHRYECGGARERSIKEISRLGLSINGADKIAMAKKFGVEEWLVPACVALVERENPLTYAEAHKLGLEMTVLVSKAREKYIRVQRQGSGPPLPLSQFGGHFGQPTQPPAQPTPTTTQIVKDILHIQ